MRRSQEKPQAMVLVEVDDWAIALDPNIADAEIAKYTSRFKFGKLKLLDSTGTDCIGRRIRRLSDRILVDQEKYILESSHKIHIPRSQRANHDAILSPSDMAEFRSAIYKINWVGRETRAEVCGVASILASRVHDPGIGDAGLANKAIEHLRATASVPITIWRFPPPSS